MTEKEVVRNLRNGMSSVIIPDVWDNINNTDVFYTNSTINSFNRRNQKSKKKYYTLLACCLTIVISFTSFFFIIVNVHNDNNNSFTSDISITNINSLSKIKSVKVYGTVSLFEGPEKLLEEKLATYNGKKENVYEDDKYLYNFDTDGNLLEMLKISEEQSNTLSVERKDIEQNVDEIFNLYLSNVNKNDYNINIENHKNSLPAWTVTAKKYEGNVVLSNIIITFYGNGELKYLSVSYDSSDDKARSTESSFISREQAVEIALNEAEKDKYGLTGFDNNTLKISVELKSNENNNYYNIFIYDLSLKEDSKLSGTISLKVNAVTGEIIEVYQYK